jgi:hypothetical protein
MQVASVVRTAEDGVAVELEAMYRQSGSVRMEDLELETGREEELKMEKNSKN